MSDYGGHMRIGARPEPLCETESSMEDVGKAAALVLRGVGCTACLRRMLSEAEERTRILRDILEERTTS